jgi:hypothetical protein
MPKVQSKVRGTTLGPPEPVSPPFRMTAQRRSILRWAERTIRECNRPYVECGDLSQRELEDAVAERMEFFLTLPNDVLASKMLASIPEEALHEA